MSGTFLLGVEVIILLLLSLFMGPRDPNILSGTPFSSLILLAEELMVAQSWMLYCSRICSISLPTVSIWEARAENLESNQDGS